jgi:hypothetical protein
MNNNEESNSGAAIVYLPIALGIVVAGLALAGAMR